MLAAESEEVMGSLSRLGGVVEHLRDGRSGSLVIGTFDSAAQMWLPHVAKGLQKEFPDLVLELILDDLGNAASPQPQQPLRRDIDVTTEIAEAPPIERVGYERHVLVEETYRVAIPQGHELLQQYPGPVPMAALADVPMIDADFSDTGCAVIVRNACRAAGFSPRYVARSDDHHTALAFVAGRIGVTILPELAVDEAMAGFESRELVSPAPRRRVVAFVRDSSALSPQVCRAVELLQEAVAKTVARRAGRPPRAPRLTTQRRRASGGRGPLSSGSVSTGALAPPAGWPARPAGSPRHHHDPEGSGDVEASVQAEWTAASSAGSCWPAWTPSITFWAAAEPGCPSRAR